ncbi:MAG: PTS sugar transporter subunit IIA [Coprococcus sp.]|nr:PTS sugar transporter subunit IIA [Coprococcus sp.]
MRITELLKKEGIALNVSLDSKDAAIDYMVELHKKSGNITDKAAFKEGILKRESEGSTAIGEGIAIPHSKNAAVKRPGLAAMVVPNGVDYDALDGAPSNLFFMIAAPEKGGDVHLEVLSRLSMLLMDEGFRAELLAAKNKDEFLKICDKYEDEKFGAEEKSAEPEKKGYRVLAVTACPTGIAHTFMAAEALEKKGEELGYPLKAETNGSGGVKNRLTAEEIANCDGIIIAADKNVETARFDGKPVLFTKVADGIHKPEELIQKIVDGKVPVYHEEGGKKEETASGGSVGSQVYKHLMSGVSHMLPFVIGGGIMIALAFLIDTICGYGSTGGGNFGTCTPLSAFFKFVGDKAMGLMVPVLAGYIAYSIADRPGLAVGFTGGLLASSGNAAVLSYVWANEELGGFQSFVSKFAFVGEGGGNTVSGFLGGIVAGFLAGFIVLFLKKLCSKFPKSLEGIKPTLIYPLVGILLIGILMVFIFNPIIGLINTGLSNMLSSLADKNLLTLLGLILGAMMAIDMGGPINKAAYVFGTGMLATAADLVANGASQSDTAVQACYIAMAAIMVGGMVPPIGIAVACKLFPKKFTEAERGSAVSNIVMGCSFITEGAIPFAAADPLHVIPCTLVGAGVAGGLSAAFKCTLMAPHGGLFVFATVGNPLLYIVSWLVGSAITAIMLGLIKKNVA